MNRVTLLCAFFLTSSLIAQQWPQEPSAFRSIPFGANEAAIQMSLNAPRCLPGSAAGERLCRDTRSRAIGDVSTEESYLLADDAFVAAYVTFQSTDYEYVRDVFKARYGEPHSVSTSTVKTMAGATFENDSLSWRGAAGVVTLTHYSDKVTEGRALICTRGWYDKLTADAAEAKRKAARSF